MPIFELDAKSLVPIRRQAIGSGVYEAEIEILLWDNLEELTGDNLFRVARQAKLPGAGVRLRVRPANRGEGQRIHAATSEEFAGAQGQQQFGRLPDGSHP